MPADKKQQSEINKIVRSAVNDALKKSVGSTKIELDISGYEDQVDYSKQLLDNQEEYTKSVEESNNHTKKALSIAKEIQEYKQLAVDFAKEGNIEAAKEARIAIKTLTIEKNQTKELAKQSQEHSKTLRLTQQQLESESQLTSSQREANKLLETKNKITDEISRLENEIKNTTGENQDIVKSILREKLEQVKNLKEVNDLETENSKLADQLGISKEELIKLEEKYRDKIGESLSFVDDITAKIEEIPIVGGLLSKMLGADELKTKLTDIATKEFTKLKAGGASTMSAIAGSFKATIAAAGPLLPLILGIAAAVALIKFAVDIDKDITSLARNLGVSKENAKELHEEMVEVQRASDNAQMSIENQTKAMTALASATGTNTALTKELVENQVLLADNLGIQEEAAAKLNRAFAAQGLDAQKTTLEVANTVEEINNATNAGLNQKEIFQDIAAVSKEIQLRYKGNFKQLTLQVVKAKQLGLTLDRIAAIGESSLEIESSLTNEMQARVLTGKAINLNEFRQAALVGNTAKMMDELQKNAGSLAEFSAMAPYQQKAFAEALGMSTTEAANMLEQKELLDKIGVSELSKATEAQIKAANLGEEKEKELLTQLKIADTTEKLAKATEGLKNIFAGLATALQPVVDIFTLLVSQTELMQAIIFTIGGYLSGKFLGGLIKSGIQIASQTVQLIAGAAASTATATAASFGAMIPVILGAVASVGGLIYSFMDDGVMSPVGPAGYSRVLSGPEGSIALNDKDTLVAGTDLNQGGSGGNNGEVVALLKELIAKIDQPVHINIGNRAVTELEKQTTMTRRFKTSMEQGYGLHG